MAANVGITVIGGIVNIKGGSITTDAGLNPDGAIGVLPLGGTVNIYEKDFNTLSAVGVAQDIGSGSGQVNLFNANAQLIDGQAGAGVNVINTPFSFKQVDVPISQTDLDAIGQAVAADILLNPANKLLTDTGGDVTSNDPEEVLQSTQPIIIQS